MTPLEKYSEDKAVRACLMNTRSVQPNIFHEFIVFREPLLVSLNKYCEGTKCHPPVEYVTPEIKQ